MGFVTDTTAKIWLQYGEPQLGSQNSVWISLHLPEQNDSVKVEKIDLLAENLNAGIALFENLKPDTKYFYRVWSESSQSIPLNLQGLTDKDLYFRTFPSNGYKDRLDFLLMSCHNPTTSEKDGCNGFAVWSCMPQIIEENPRIRFAILGGDQVYGDDIEKELLKTSDSAIRLQLYLKVYKKFWDNIFYRKVLCSLPAVLMWDDHDITDGWGSREDSFVKEGSSEFKAVWKDLYESARKAFSVMQTSRNPSPLFENQEKGFDTCFKIGRSGFIVMDLRSNRNVRKPQITSIEQREAIKKWVEANRDQIDTLFFVSSVVFSHGTPEIEKGIIKWWFLFLDLIARLKKTSRFKTLAENLSNKVGDLRDDINDSWGAEINAEETDQILDFLFELQNPSVPETKALNIVILSGDIHTPGYSTIYSSNPNQKRVVIPHITATPVAYEPFSWIGEAVFRHVTRIVKLGKKDVYTSQVSHHFCRRNVVVVSVRDFEGGEHQLKVKYYLEGYPEPQIMLFDLRRGSHLEKISWPQKSKNQL